MTTKTVTTKTMTTKAMTTKPLTTKTDAQDPPPGSTSAPISPRARRLAGFLVLAGTVLALGASLAVPRRGVSWVEASVENLQPAAPLDPALDERQRRAERRLAALAPRGKVVLVDSYGGHLRVYEGDRLLREAVASAGSGSALRDPRNGKIWVFETPVGEHRVQRKVTDPVWIKPDWAFIEEGEEPPPIGHPERRDTVSLGDYALYLGDGYLIHGTLFQTTLGRRVTHGCIRLGDEDLAWVYRNVPVGAPVWLY